MASRYLADLSAKMGHILPLSRGRNGSAGSPDGADGESQPNGGLPAVIRKMDDGPDGYDEVMSLFTSIHDQALELQYQFAKATSEWNVALNVLAGRASTLDPLISDTLKSAKESERSVEELTSTNQELKQKLATAERELLYYRPMALRLDDELRVAKDQIEDQARRIRSFETENAKTMGAYNDLYQKLAAAESANERVTEENVAYSQKLNDNDNTIQTLLRNVAQLKSDLMAATSALDRAEKESAELADKLTAENEELKRAQASFETIKMQMLTLKKESAAQLRAAEERERQATDALVAKDKQVYDLEVKLASVNSKNDFLDRVVQRMRDDVRRHLDHIGTIEASNRQLLDALSRNTSAPEPESEKTPAAGGPPKLRAVSP